MTNDTWTNGTFKCSQVNTVYRCQWCIKRHHDGFKYGQKLTWSNSLTNKNRNNRKLSVLFTIFTRMEEHLLSLYRNAGKETCKVHLTYSGRSPLYTGFRLLNDEHLSSFVGKYWSQTTLSFTSRRVHQQKGTNTILRLPSSKISKKTCWPWLYPVNTSEPITDNQRVKILSLSLEPYLTQTTTPQDEFTTLSTFRIKNERVEFSELWNAGHKINMLVRYKEG